MTTTISGSESSLPTKSAPRRYVKWSYGPVLSAACFIVVMAVTVPTLVIQFLVIAFLSMTVATAAVGVAVTAVSPPLPKWANTSILGSRVSWLAKLWLAILVLPYTSIIVWLVNDIMERSAASADQFVDGLKILILNILTPIALALVMVALVWLSVDLIRLGGRSRANAVDSIIRKFGIGPGAIRRTLRNGMLLAVSTWWWTLSAFYVSPLAMLVFVELLAHLKT